MLNNGGRGCLQLKFHFILPFVPGSLNSLLKIQKFRINFALEFELDEKHLKYFRVPLENIPWFGFFTSNSLNKCKDVKYTLGFNLELIHNTVSIALAKTAMIYGN